MSLELTEKKSNIGSGALGTYKFLGALNDLVFIMSCNRTVVVDPSAISRQSVGDQLGSDRQPIGDQSATGWRLYHERLFLNAETLQLFGDWSATDRRLKTVSGLSATAELVGDQSPTSRRPVSNLSATIKNLSTIDLVAERFHLQQPKPPCDQIVPATFCNQSATSHRPPCNHPATSLRPPEILVARRSPTGCKLCVTGALDRDAWGLRQAPGPCLTTETWRCRKNYSQWECSFHWKLCCHWLEFLRQCQIVVVRQGPGPGCWSSSTS